MAHYRKIDVAIWNDEKFQDLWRRRLKAPTSVPKSLRNPRGKFSKEEVSARSKRCYFAKHKHEFFFLVSSMRGALCSSCQATTNLVIDHVIPIRWGGENVLENMQILCSPCNSAKGGILPDPPESENSDGR